jgi:hypothetical protein
MTWPTGGAVALSVAASCVLPKSAARPLGLDKLKA